MCEHIYIFSYKTSNPLHWLVMGQPQTVPKYYLNVHPPLNQPRTIHDPGSTSTLRLQLKNNLGINMDLHGKNQKKHCTSWPKSNSCWFLPTSWIVQCFLTLTIILGVLGDLEGLGIAFFPLSNHQTRSIPQTGTHQSHTISNTTFGDFPLYPCWWELYLLHSRTSVLESHDGYHITVVGDILLFPLFPYGSFHKWGYPQMAGLQWTISIQNGW